MVEIETLEKNASKTKSFRVVDVIREESYLTVINLSSSPAIYTHGGGELTNDGGLIVLYLIEGGVC